MMLRAMMIVIRISPPPPTEAASIVMLSSKESLNVISEADSVVEAAEKATFLKRRISIIIFESILGSIRRTK